MSRFKYETPEQLQTGVDSYFLQKDIKFTATGLILHLGFACKNHFYNQAKRGEDWDEIVTTARTRIENVYEERLHTKDCTGAIFALKNMGWTDRQDIEVSGKDGKALEFTLSFNGNDHQG